MQVRVQSIHFDATEKLQAFIEKKFVNTDKKVLTNPVQCASI